MKKYGRTEVAGDLRRRKLGEVQNGLNNKTRSARSNLHFIITCKLQPQLATKSDTVMCCCNLRSASVKKAVISS